MFDKLLKQIRLRKKTKEFKKNATLQGTNIEIGMRSFIRLADGARKENVIFKEGCWPLGQIAVQSDGVFIMHEHSKIESSTRIQCVNRVEIGPYTAVAENTVICDNNNHPISPSFRKKMRLTPARHQMRMWKYSASAPIIIGENCWIGSNADILKGSTLGNDTVVAWRSLLTKDYNETNILLAGSPAVIKERNIHWHV